MVKIITMNGSSWIGNANLFNEEGIKYDKNGNISAMNRTAPINGVNSSIDQLVYKYEGNRLTNVHDNSLYYDGNNANPDFGFKEIAHNTGLIEYAYDVNGSMTSDMNKSITSIQYNHLNLPKLVTLSGNRTIEYTYDAAGVKLRKIASTGGTVISQTDYVGGIQYEGTTSVLKFVATPEGRVVKKGSTWDYEYFHKDHLGNTRVVYGYMKQVDEYKATMETALASQEEAAFKNVAATRVIAYNHTPASGQFTVPDKSAETNGNLSGKAIGPAKMLQVSAGDSLHLEVFARYSTGTGANNTLITTLASAVTGTFGLGAGEAAYNAINNNVPARAATFSSDPGVPKAYLFYILFDNNYVYQQFGYKVVSGGAMAGHECLNLGFTIPASGYLYTYVANESNVSTATSVYFDDFNIIHTRAASALQVIQTMDYFPFGLTFNSYQRENSVPNQYQNSGREKQDELGLNWIDFGARTYMPDIGRWNSIDDVADMFDDESPYSYAANNPVNVIDVGGYFRISAEFANKYPTLAKMIAHYLPLLKGNQTVKNAWMKVTNGTSAQFNEMVTYGSGPEIIPTQPENASIYNQNDPYSSEDSKFDPDHPDKIFLAPESLQELEEEMKKAMNGQENQMGPQMFLVSLKIMHEAAHYGVFKHKGEKAFWLLEGSAGVLGGDQGAQWEGKAYKRFSYKNIKSAAMDKGDVFNYYQKNYSDDKMRGMTLNPQMFYNFIMLMGPTPGTSEPAKKKKPDADREASKRSGGG